MGAVSSSRTEAHALLAAVHFAAEKHRLQTRKDEDESPYVNHVIQVAEVLARVGGVTDLDVLVAAVLHDTVEDTRTTREELAECFNERVASLVQKVSDDKTLSKEERKRLAVEHAPELPFEAKLIKLADRICNVRDIAEHPPVGWDLDRRLEYFEWSRGVVAGCRGVNGALELEFDTAVEEAEARVRLGG